MIIITGNPGGFSNLQVYYVVATATNTFQLSASRGGTAISPTSSTAPQVVGVPLLSTGNNLGTTGILNGVSTTMFIAATGTGFVTLPSTTSANLFVTPGNGAITINAPIQDNGAGALTLVKNGSNTLTLTGTNTYTGGTLINAGTLLTTADTNLGTGGGITVNGTATWNMSTATLVTYNRSLTINDGATLTLSSGNAAKTITGVLSGSGNLIGAATTGYIFSNTGNTFTGTVNNGYQMVFASLGDSSNPINLNGSNSEFQWNGGEKTFASRVFTLNNTIVSSAAGQINNNGTGALTIQQALAISGPQGVRGLILGGSNTGANVFAGNIADGTGSVVSLTKSGTGLWALSGTNTYSGATINGLNNPAGVALIFQGIQALSPSTTLQQTHPGTVGGFGTIKILDDAASPASRSGVNLNLQSNNTTHTMTLFLGNNNTANGGSSSGTTTGSTILLGNVSFTQTSSNNVGQTIAVTGANGYRLQINDVNLPALQASSTSWSGIFTPTTAPLTIAGTVRQVAGSAVTGATTLTLDGTTTSFITGSIRDSLDATPQALKVTKNTTTGIWILSGANTYSGATLINGSGVGGTGMLVGIGANAFGSTPAITMNGTTGAILSLRGDANTIFVRASESVPYTITSTSPGATIDVDLATIAGTSAKTMTIGALNTTSTSILYQVNFTGSNNTSLSIGSMTGSASASPGSVTVNNSIASPGILTISSFTSTNTAASDVLILTGSGDTTITGSVTPSTTVLNVRMTGTGSATLTGSSSYTGTTYILSGILSFNSIGNVGGGPSAIGNPSTLGNGIILVGSDTTSGVLRYTGSGHSTDRFIQINASNNTATGSATIQNDGSGALIFTSTTFNSAYPLTSSVIRTLTLSGTNGGTIQGVIQDNSATGKVALIKGGTGAWTISGSNTYTGVTNASGGTLLINGNQSTATGAVSVASTATLGGTGTVGGITTVQSGGFIAPGVSSGTLNINANTTLESGSTYAFELSTAGSSALADTGLSSPLTLPHTNHDMLNVTGTLTLSGSKVNISSLGSTGLITSNSYSWLIATASGGITGTPTLGTPISGTDFTAYTTAGGSFNLNVVGNNLYLNATPVPEPISILAIGVGVYGLGTLIRRRKYQSC